MIFVYLNQYNFFRQSLFAFDDAANGGKLKAVTAAEGLRKINPLINAEGVCLKIPMPGHSVSQHGSFFEATGY